MLIEATAVLLDAHTPPVVASANVVARPVQAVADPVIADGLATTVIDFV